MKAVISKTNIKTFQKKLAAIDTTGWSITKQVDYHLVRAEMNGLDFHHRVLRPWSRDPCFYSIRPGMTDPLDIEGILPNPESFPLSDNDLGILNEKLVKVPRIYSQAVQNLYNPAKDLTSLAIHFTKEDVMLLDDLTNNLKEYHPTLLLVAKNARDAVQNYLDYLIENEPSLIEPSRFREIHRHIVCRNNMILGITGDLSWSDAEVLIQNLVSRVPACADSLPDSPVPDILREAGIFVIEKDLEQAVIVMAHPTSVKLADDPTYFAATMGNSILGGGGFTSRLLSHLRTEEGFAYSASSLWTTPRRYDGLVGAVTTTNPENAVPALEVMLETMQELREAPPTDRELGTAVSRVVNSFVFNFQTPAQVVSRVMFYLADDLPEDWLERYSRGIQEITSEQVHEVFVDHLYPEEMTILVVGDVDRIGRAALERLGPVTVLRVD